VAPSFLFDSRDSSTRQERSSSISLFLFLLSDEMKRHGLFFSCRRIFFFPFLVLTSARPSIPDCRSLRRLPEVSFGLVFKIPSSFLALNCGTHECSPTSALSFSFFSFTYLLLLYAFPAGSRVSCSYYVVTCFYVKRDRGSLSSCLSLRSEVPLSPGSVLAATLGWTLFWLAIFPQIE